MRFGCGLLLCLLYGMDAAACNLPVFRFALERWSKRNHDEIYTLYVFHDGRPSDNLRAELDKLEARLEDAGAPANLVLYRIDTSKPIRDEALSAVHEQARSKLKAASAKTFMVLRYPDAWELKDPLYVGAYDRGRIDTWLQSPVRQKIARRILLGHAAVFLFLESGDKAKDDERYALAEHELARLEKAITLPELTDAPKDQLLREDIPLKVSFALLRLSKEEAAEAFLIDMLRGMDETGDLASTKEPVLLAVYGRGIAMANKALFGKGINADNIEGLATFLAGRCSCEIRRLNPGIEMLMAVNWEGAAPSEPEERSGKPGETMDSFAIPGEATGLWRNVLWIAVGIVGLMAVGTCVRLLRKGRD